LQCFKTNGANIFRFELLSQALAAINRSGLTVRG
jgi:hypothetical protein